MDDIDAPCWEYPDRREPCFLDGGMFSDSIHAFLAWVGRLPAGFPKLKALAQNGRVGDPFELAKEVVRAAPLIDTPRVRATVESLSDILLHHMILWDLEHFPEPDPAELVVSDDEDDD